MALTLARPNQHPDHMVEKKCRKKQGFWPDSRPGQTPVKININCKVFSWSLSPLDLIAMQREKRYRLLRNSNLIEAVLQGGQICITKLVANPSTNLLIQS